jgi:hypothetical protein
MTSWFTSEIGILAKAQEQPDRAVAERSVLKREVAHFGSDCDLNGCDGSTRARADEG